MLETENNTDNYADMTVLCVDDEVSMLSALKRVFHRQPFRVLTAQSAKQALVILEQHTVNLIITDMRMPEMDGVQLLQKVALLDAHIHRIILSGYADFESTVEAINLGKIQNFINKPWHNAELISVVKEGLNRVKLKQENIRLNLLVKKQNEKLKAWNSELENKINLRTKQIRSAFKINERNIRASEKMLVNFIAINPHLNGDFGRNVGRLAARLAENLYLEKSLVNEIRQAGELIEIGMLALDPLICRTPFKQLNYEQKKEFLSQGKIAKQILSPAQHMNNVSQIIAHQYIPISDIYLPEPLATAIKVVVIARDYWRYATGKILPTHLDHIHIRIELTKGMNIYYDEEILNILIAEPDLATNIMLEKGITSQQLEPGMLLKYNLYTHNHLLLLAEGHEFSTSSIEHLMEYEKNQKHEFSIVIESKSTEISS